MGIRSTEAPSRRHRTDHRRHHPPRLEVLRTGRRWWNRVTASVLTAGGLAAAVASVLALWPDPDPVDSAQITSLRVPAVVPISQYEARAEELRSAGGAPPDLRLVGLTGTPTPAGTAEGPGGTTTAPTTAEPETSPAEPASPTSDPGTPTAEPATPTGSTQPTTFRPGRPLSPRVLLDTRTAFATVDTDRYTDDVLDRMPGTGPVGCASREAACRSALRDIALSLALRSSASSTAPGPTGVSTAPGQTGDTGTLARPTVTARELVELFADVRTIVREDGTREAVGALATVDVELAGLRGEPVVLRYELLQPDLDTPLLTTWYRRVEAVEFTAGAERATASQDFWVPLPRQPGAYVVRAELWTDRGRVASAESEPVAAPAEG